MADERKRGDSVAYQVDPLAERHVRAVAEAHQDCFPDYFLTNLGIGFLECYYRSYLDTPSGVGTVAVAPDGRVLGFCVGTTDGSEYESRLYRHYAGRIAWTILAHFFTNASLRRQFFGRLGHVWRAVLTVLRLRSREQDVRVSEEDAVARLKSIGVRSEARGSGVARDVQQAFELEMARRGVRKLGLSVLAGNDRAIAFYHKTGWRQIKATARGIWFVKDLPEARP